MDNIEVMETLDSGRGTQAQRKFKQYLINRRGKRRGGHVSAFY